ncbi:amidohydrolase [Stappia sp.]|uniref:amidohydrolase n=1 Tax=Stappia sp. TaxID=1870903 RepID=UPI003A98E1BB
MPKSLLAMLLAGFSTLPAFAAETVADRIWSGGPILTMNDLAPRAEAVAEKDGKIIAVGRADEVMKHEGEGTKLIDLKGRAMLPGFVDAHGHAFMIGVQAVSANTQPAPDGKVNDIPALQQMLGEWQKAYPERIKRLGTVLGFGYDDAQLKEQRHPTRADLDAVSEDVPVVIIHQSGHIGVFNSKALEVAGISAQTKDPDGGVIRREDGGSEPNGVLEEAAFFPALMKLLSGLDQEGGQELFVAGTELLASYGYTTGQEGRSTTNVVKLMRAAADAGRIKIDVVTYPDVLVDRDYIAQTVSRTYTNGFRVAGAKLTIDGSPQGFTALRDRPYYNPPAQYRRDYAGYAAASTDQVFDAIDWAFENDIQIITHANGEGASDMLIAAVGTAREKHGAADRRPVLIHGQFMRKDQVVAIDELDVFPSLFPMHTFYWGDWHRDRTVGPVNADNISPTGWVRERGMMFSSHHDAPVAFPDSMRILDATVTRRTRSGDILGPHQRVDVMTALKAMTIWPAYQHFEEAEKGSIEVGKVADLVVLSNDPTAIDPEALDTLKIQETIKRGQTIYTRKDDEKQGNLRMRPGPDGSDALGNFLRHASSSAEASGGHAHGPDLLYEAFALGFAKDMPAVIR